MPSTNMLWLLVVELGFGIDCMLTIIAAMVIAASGTDSLDIVH